MHHGEIVKKCFPGECWTTLPDPDPGHKQAIDKFGLKFVVGKIGEQGLSPQIGRITYGGNSGHQAIHLARNMGAAKIILLGYDFHGNGSHWFGEHPQEIRGGHDYNLWLSSIKHLARDLKNEGIEVINCTPGSAITCFEKREIKNA